MYSIILVNKEEIEDAYIEAETLEDVKEKVQFIYEPAAIKNQKTGTVVAIWVNFDYEAQVYEEKDGNNWIWLH